MKNKVFILLAMLSIASLSGCVRNKKQTESQSNPPAVSESTPASEESTPASETTPAQSEGSTESTPVTPSSSEEESTPVQSDESEEESTPASEEESTPASESSEEDTRPDYEKGDPKEVEGFGVMFNETIGFNTKDASVFDEDENNRYVIYASNEVAKGKQVFAARKGTKQNGEWVYGEKHIILRGATDEEAWDQYIYQPSVIKGTFTLGGVNYAYLMAYQGNEDGTNYNNHIGLAVSNNVLGEWIRVGEDPLIENPELYESSFGFGSPELVSYNQQGKAYLFYSFGETQLSGTRVKTADFSDLDHINLEAGYAELPVAGLIGRDDNITSNAGFAISSDNKLYYAGDGMPDSSAPGCATSFEVAKANLGIIQNAAEEWTSIQKVDGLDTGDLDEYLGWDEIYSPVFIRDAYGRINPTTKLEVVYSTFDVDNAQNAAYTAQLCVFEVDLSI